MTIIQQHLVQFVWEQIKQGKNIDKYSIIIVAIVLAVFNLIGLQNPTWINSVILAALTVTVISQLQNQHDLLENRSHIERLEYELRNKGTDFIDTNFVLRLGKVLDETLSAQNGFSIKAYQASQEDGGDRILYGALEDFVSSAKKSIRVVHRFMPPLPEIEDTPARQKYYRTLEETLDKKYKARQRFRYQRIIQVDEVQSGSLNYEQTDPILFSHCQNLLNFKNNAPLKIYLRQTVNVIGAIGFVIVDDYKVFLLIPTITKGRNDKMRAIYLATGLLIIDHKQVFIGQLLNLFQDLLLGADEIVNIDNSEVLTPK